MAEERHLPPQDVGQTKALVPMEHGAPTKILPVEIMWRTTTFPNFPVYLILLQLLVLLRQILLQYFMYLFKPKGPGTFLQMHVFIVFKKEEHLDSTMFYCLNSQSSQSGWTPQRVNFFSNPQEWTNHPKRVKVLKVPEVDRGWKFYQVHKVDGPTKGWKFY